METNAIISTKPNCKTPANDKDYFAAYLNMAQHNAFIALTALNRKIFPDDTSKYKEGNLSQVPVVSKLDDTSKPELTLRIQDWMDKRFPFLKPVFASEQYYVTSKEQKESPDLTKDYKKVLTLFFNHLNDLRNYYSHVDHEEVRIENSLFIYLNNILDASVRSAQKNNNYTDAEIQHLVPFTYKRKGKEVEKLDNPAFKYKIRNEKHLSTEGLALFICLFLEKQYISEFLGKLQNFKDRRERNFRATIDTYKAHTIDVPYDRIDGLVPKVALALDMLNELKRCPASLWDTLSPEDQLKFKVPSESTDETTDSDVYADIFWQKRHSNRFPQFALSYIDKMEAFKSIRFHVDMGSYFYKFYDKTLLDGVARQRKLSIPIKAFGRIDDLENLRRKLWDNLIVSNPPENYDNPYITDTFPHYHLNNQQIGIFDTQEEGVCLPKPDGANTRLQQPDAWLSEYELPGLLFYAYLTRSNNTKPAEQLIKNYIASVRLLFDDIASGKLAPQSNATAAQKALDAYRIELVNMPDELKRYLCGETADRNDLFNKHAARMIDLLLHQTTQCIASIKLKMTLIKGKSNKVGKKRFVEIQAGVLADFLARDMLKFQPSLSINSNGNMNGRDKITSANFRALQAHLAFYGRDHQLLSSFFAQSGLTKGHNPHPFLSHMDPSQYADIVSFYLAYLYERKKYLETCRFQKRYTTYYFLKPDKKRWLNTNGYHRKLVQRYRQLPVNLPRGLFLDALKQWFAANGSPALKEIVASNPRVNTIYLLQKYAECEMHDGSQEFYAFGRSYKCIDKLIGRRMGNKLERNYFGTAAFSQRIPEWKARIDQLPYAPAKIQLSDTRLYDEPMKKLWHRFNDTEKTIRLVRAQDILQFILARHILLSEKVPELAFIENSIGFKLAGISPYSEQGPLSVQVPCALKVHGKTITHTLKIKNYGDFVRFTRDRRLKGLFAYIEANTLKLSGLQRELDDYNDARLAVSAYIHSFEKAIFEKLKADITTHNASNPTKQGRYNYTNFNSHIAVFTRKFPLLKDQCTELKIIRNAFMHNEYPLPGSVCISANGSGIARQLNKRTQVLTNTFIEKLKEI
ncbi:MAG TPA: type VI-B CRISPR-associated RNA-guided ribonuclease Cas13b [Bacteroidales bacterium]|nr:type VI-B CRISPR-associated RNA-guided ribonuclease Cas13b [Bacteroidales bacterium]